MTKEKNKKKSPRSLATACFFVLLLVGSFLFGKDSLAVPNDYNKFATSTLLAAEWNHLLVDFVNTFGTSSMVGPLGIGTTNPGAALHLSAGTGENNGIKLSANGWPYYTRVGINGTSGGQFILSQNYSYANSAVDASGYGTTAMIMDTVAGSISLNTGIVNTAPTQRMTIVSNGNVGIGTTAPNDIFSIGNSGSAPAGSSNTGHNYTSTYLTADNYALTNYGLVRTLIASATSSLSTLWGGTTGGNVWNLNSGNVGIGTTGPKGNLNISKGASMPTSFSAANTYLQIGAQEATVNGLQTIGFGYSSTNMPAYIGFNETDNSSFTKGDLVFATRNGVTDAVPSEIMRITSSGNVGIGTTAPNSRLDIHGVGTTTAFALQVSDSLSNPKFSVLDSGNVGIGVTNPGAKLQVLGKTLLSTNDQSSYSYGDDGSSFRFYSTGYTADYGMSLIGNQNWNGNTASPTFFIRNSYGGYGGAIRKGMGVGGIDFSGDSTSGWISGARIKALASSQFAVNQGYSTLAFATNNGTASPSDRMYITAPGNVLIGYTFDYYNNSYSPTADDLVNKLQVNGGAYISGNVGIGTTAPNDKLSIGSSGTAAPAGSADTGHNYTSTYLAADNYALTNYGLVKSLIGSATSTMGTFWGGTTGGNVWNLNSGNIGIGTTNPAAKLQVVGGISSPGSGGGDEQFGLNAIATSSTSIAVGNGSYASYYSSSLGNAASSSNQSVSVGNSASSSGGGVAIGRISKTSQGVAVGFNADSSGGGVSIGSGSIGGTGVSIGNGSSAGPTYAVTVGNATQSGSNSVRLGSYGGSSSYSEAIVLGNFAVPTSNRQLVIGSSNPGWGGRISNVLINAQGDDIVFNRDGGTVMTWKSNANVLFTNSVGIGTTAPNDKLSIGSGGVAAPAGSADTGHNYTMTYLSADQYALINYGTMMTLLNAATTTNALWNGTKNGNIYNGDAGAGNVGVGTTNPLAKLSVYGAGGVTSGISIQNTSGHDWRIFSDVASVGLKIGGSNGTQNFWESTWAGPVANLFKSPSATVTSIPVVAQGAVGQTANLFQVQNSSGVGLSGFNASGNLGVGMIAPGAKIDIYGGTIGDVANNTINFEKFNSVNTYGNTDKLEFNQVRVSGGTDWVGNSFQISRSVDSSPMGKISFYGGGVTIGALNNNGAALNVGGNIAVDPTTRIYSNPHSQSFFGFGYTWGGIPAVAGQITIGNQDSDMNFGDWGSNGFRFYNNASSGTATELMRINGSGNVGINTTAPNDKLSIGSGGVAAPTGSADTGHNYTMTYLSADQYALINYGTMMTLLNAATTTNALWNGTKNGNIYNGDAGAGNVGIGTTNPTEKLDINGNLRLALNGQIKLVGTYQTPIISTYSSLSQNGIQFTMPAVVPNNIYMIPGPNSWFTTIFSGGTVGLGINNNWGGSGNSIGTFIKGQSWINNLLDDGLGNASFIGNVGIGTTTVNATLRIGGASPSVGIGPYFSNSLGRFSISGSVGEISLLSRNASSWTETPANGERWVQYAESGLFKIWSGTDKLAINKDGNVGIGTTAPNDKLSIGNSGVAPVGSLATGHNYTMTYLSSDPYALVNYGTTMSLINAATTTNALWNGTKNGNIYNGDAGAGNVGVGTTNPTEKLTVSGNALVTGNVYSSKIIVNPTSGIGWYRISAPGAQNGGTVYLNAGMDNRNQQLEFNYNIRGWIGNSSMVGSITVTRSMNYNTGPISSIRIGSDGSGSAYLDIYVNSATSPAAFTVYGTNGAQFLASPQYNPIDPAFSKTVDLAVTNYWGIQTTDSANIGGNAFIAGNVGIGTTNPAYPLQVGITGTNGTFAVNTGSNSWFGIYNNANGGYYGFQSDLSSMASGVKSAMGGWYSGLGIFANVASTAGSTQIFGVKMTDWNSVALGTLTTVPFGITNKGVVFTHNNILDDGTGNVGIGTTAPNDKLSIGNSGVAPAGSLATGHNYTMTYLSSDPYALTNYGTVMTLLNAATTTNALWNGTKNGNIYNGDAGAGNVGIGTTTPLYKLEVNGTFKVSTSSSSIMLDSSGNVLIGI